MIDPELRYRIAQARAEYEAVQTVCVVRSMLVAVALARLEAEPVHGGVVRRFLRALGIWRG